MIKQKKIKILTLLIIIYIFTFSTLSCLRHEMFLSGWDLGVSEDIAHNTLSGKFFFSDDHGINHLGLHFNFIYILFFPFYFLFSNTNTLLIFQTIIISSGAIIIYFLSNKLLKNNKIALICSIIYLISPVIWFNNLGEFHKIILAIPIFLLMIYAFVSKKMNWYYFFLILFLLVQENYSLTALFFGIFVFFRNKKIGLKTILISLLAFIMLVFIIIPNINSSNSYEPLGFYFSHLGTNFKELTINIIRNPISAITYSGRVLENVSFVLFFLLTFVFIPFLSPSIIITFPLLAQNLLSSYRFNICYTSYNNLVLFLVFFIAFIFGLKKIKNCVNKKTFFKIIYLLLVFNLVMTLFFGIIPLTSKDYLDKGIYSVFEKQGCYFNHFNIESIIKKESFHSSQKNYKELNRLIINIPKNKSIVSSYHIFSHTVKHPDSKAFNPNIECILSDFVIIDNSDVDRPLEDNLTQIFESNNYKTYWQKDKIYVFEKINKIKECLIKTDY